MPKKKPSFYAVARGREPGVYLTWAEAEKQVKGFPGSVHRAFNTKAEADKYVAQCRNDAKQEPRSDQDAQLSDRFENMAIDPSQRLQCLHDHPLVAFCAGSAPSNGSGTAAYGVSFPLEEGFIRSAQVEDPQTNYHADCVAAQEVVRIANELDPKKERALVIYSRCLDLVSAMEYPRWIDKWQQNGWTTSANEAVSYQDIFRTLLEAETLRTIMWIFVDEKKSLRCLVELHLQAYHEAERVARAAAAAATGGSTESDFDSPDIFFMGWYEYDSDNGYEYYEPSWYYAVAVGRSTGIYTSHRDAVEQVHGFPGFRMQKFSDYEDARDYLEEFDIYCESLTDDDSDQEEEVEDYQDSDVWFYAVAVGRSTGIFLSFEDAQDQIYGYPRSRMEQFLDYEEAEKFIENYQAFGNEEEKRGVLSKKSKIWFYAVAVGRSTGVFLDNAEALEQVHGFSGFKMKKFRELDDAESYIAFNQVYSSDEEEENDIEEDEKWFYAVAVGRCVGVYTDWEYAKNQVHGFSRFRMKKFEDYNEALEYIIQNRMLNCEEGEETSDETQDETWYYAVAVGRRIGIYLDHQNAMDQVYGYSGSRMKKFLNYNEAQEFIGNNQWYFSEGESDADESGPMQEEVKWYYAVAVGRSPGIYMDHKDALDQVHGFSGFRMKKFLDYDEAQEYIDFNHVYSSDERESEEEEEEVWYYAVAVGRSTGVYRDWQQAKDQVHGYSGFRMKKFQDYDEALEYIDDHNNNYVDVFSHEQGTGQWMYDG